VTLDNTIVAGNALSSGPASDVSGTLNTSSFNNLIGSGGSGGLTNGVDGNIVGITSGGLHLGALARNGGPTQTIEPLTGSPAIANGSVSLAEAAGLTTDQRGPGYARIVNGSVYIGAYQSQFAYPVITTNPTSQSADAGNTVTFTAAASGNPTPTVQWQVSSDHGRKFTNIAGATSATYNFTAAADQNGDDYRAAFTNSQGSATSNAAPLTVISSSIGGDVYDVHGGAGMAGVTVTLQPLKHGRPKGSASNTTTNSNGDYSFAGLAAATYSVSESLPSRYKLITPPSGSITIGLSAGQSSTGNDFGDKKKRGRADAERAMLADTPFAITTELGNSTASQADGSVVLYGKQDQQGLFAG
jgi:hypothetical protein